MNTETFWPAFTSLSNFFRLSPAQRIQKISFLLDESIPLPMMRIGIDPFFSIIPIFGSFFGLALSCYFFWEASNLKAPWYVYLKMGLNLLIDAGLGMIPGAGFFVDAMFKANVRNRKILLRYIDSKV